MGARVTEHPFEPGRSSRTHREATDMRICILGTGPVGLGCAALLRANGHDAVLWSPRRPVADGARQRVETFGLLESCGDFPVMSGTEGLARALHGADAAILCLRANGFRSVIDQLAATLDRPLPVIVSSDLSLAGLYLSRKLAEAGHPAPVVVWSTTLTGGPIREGRVHVRLRRGRIDMSAIPAAFGAQGLTLCTALFGEIFAPVAEPLAITLSNLNPPIHMANCLLNFTRIELGEVWQNFGGITPGVGRLIEALDRERLAVAARFGLCPRTVEEHYRKSFPGLPQDATVHEMAQIVEGQRRGSSPGPATLATRFITEDLPFGILPVIRLARMAGVEVPAHTAGLTLIGLACGEDFATRNDLLDAVGLEGASPSDLLRRMREGWQMPAAMMQNARRVTPPIQQDDAMTRRPSFAARRTPGTGR